MLASTQKFKPICYNPKPDHLALQDASITQPKEQWKKAQPLNQLEASAQKKGYSLLSSRGWLKGFSIPRDRSVTTQPTLLKLIR